MHAFLIQPTDTLFFRDGIPMSAGQGHGAGCRLPFPSTLHEALRASLLKHSGLEVHEMKLRGRDHKTIASKAFQSLTTAGPLPWHKEHGLLLPEPTDVAFGKEQTTLHRLHLLPTGDIPSAGAFAPACWPVAITPPDKHGQLHGWWTVAQYRHYLDGKTDARDEAFAPIPTEALWQPEHRIGLAIDPARSTAEDGMLFAGTYLRPDEDTRFWFQPTLRHEAAAANGEGQHLASLDWLLLGGDRRLARLQPEPTDLLAPLRSSPSASPGDGPVLLKWILLTPAIFAHGSLPGWCKDSRKDRPGGRLPEGRVCLDLPGAARLISWSLAKPQTVTGFDALKGEAKPTQLAVPAGGVYYFLCQDAATANALAAKLHWQPRSDHYGEKGCGYGLVSFDTPLHPTSPDIRQLASTLFNT